MRRITRRRRVSSQKRFPAKMAVIIVVILIAVFIKFFHIPLFAPVKTTFAPYTSQSTDFVNMVDDIKKVVTKHTTKDAKSYILPLNNQITSFFGERTDPIEGEDKMHTGIDITATKAESILCAGEGEIIEAGTDESYGNYIIVRHDSNIKTFYAHLDSAAKKVGDKVKKAEVLGFAGQTGKATGVHLHFEVRLNDVAIDPILFLNNQKS